MRKAICVLFLLCGLASAHTPTITPSKGKMGDHPPVLEDKPLPPFLTIVQPMPGVFIIL